MSTKYVEIDSSFRDRNLYPEPSTFIVEIAQSGQNNRLDAKDPITDASPILAWNNSFVHDNALNTISNITVTSSNGIQGVNTFQISTADIIPGPEGDKFRQVRDFYVGASITITNAGITTTRRITQYLPLNLHNAILSIESPLPDSVIGLSTFHIDNPTPLPTNTPNTVIKVFIPGSNSCFNNIQNLQTYGLGGDNFYKGYYMQQENVFSNFEAIKIIHFDSTTRLATLESPTTGFNDWGVALGGFPNNYVIRKELPIFYINSFFAPISTSQIYIGPSSSNIDNFYTGFFIRFIPYVTIGGPSITTYFPPETEERRIINYDGTTQIATVFPPFSTLPPIVPGNSITFEIEQFTRDNAVQFNFTNSIISSDQIDTYEITLLNLVLPNTLLSSGRGGRAIFYPYFYVELKQISTSISQSMNIINSNNPNSYRMLFRAIVDDTPVPVISPFIKIDGDGMKHILKIKPYDSFRFSVYHPNGELFKTVIQDTASPTQPNPLCQISACFSFKKIISNSG